MYHLNKQYRLRKEEDGAGLMSDKLNAQIYVLNPTAMSIMTLLEHEPHNLDEIVTDVDTKFEGAGRQTISDEIESFVQYSKANGFIEECRS